MRQATCMLDLLGKQGRLFQAPLHSAARSRRHWSVTVTLPWSIKSSHRVIESCGRLLHAACARSSSISSHEQPMLGPSCKFVRH